MFRPKDVLSPCLDVQMAKVMSLPLFSPSVHFHCSSFFAVVLNPLVTLSERNVLEVKRQGWGRTSKGRNIRYLVVLLS